MVTAEEARQLRVDKGAVNHETYRTIFERIAQRIQMRAKRGEEGVEYKVPPFIPGRPVYEVAHAVRYCRDKLGHRGFRVHVHDDGMTLSVDWKERRGSSGQKRITPAAQGIAAAQHPKTVQRTTMHTAPPPKKNMPKTRGDIAQRLNLLAQKLNWK